MGVLAVATSSLASLVSPPLLVLPLALPPLALPLLLFVLWAIVGALVAATSSFVSPVSPPLLLVLLADVDTVSALVPSRAALHSASPLLGARIADHPWGLQWHGKSPLGSPPTSHQFLPRETPRVRALDVSVAVLPLRATSSTPPHLLATGLPPSLRSATRPWLESSTSPQYFFRALSRRPPLVTVPSPSSLASCTPCCAGRRSRWLVRSPCNTGTGGVLVALMYSSGLLSWVLPSQW